MAVADGAPGGRKPPIAVKFFYGLGNMGESSFITAVAFVFFYYTAVLGLSGSLVGAALFLGLCADAVVDPFFGSWSDNLKSQFGRRIPLMLFGGPLMGLSVGMLFTPPPGLPELGLFAWLAGWAMAVRAFVSMFHVPYVALGAEMSSDYHDRSSVVAWRTVFGILAQGGMTGMAYSVFFKGGLQLPEQHSGLDDAAADNGGGGRERKRIASAHSRAWDHMGGAGGKIAAVTHRAVIGREVEADAAPCQRGAKRFSRKQMPAEKNSARNEALRNISATSPGSRRNRCWRTGATTGKAAA